MTLTETFSLAVIVLAALYLIALGIAALIAPAQAKRFLLAFASSPTVHFTEQFVRLMVGAALVHHAPHMLFSGGFKVFGWVLLFTSSCLLVMPWQWHHRFAKLVVPHVTKHLVLVGLVSLAMGGFILVAAAPGSAV